MCACCESFYYITGVFDTTVCYDWDICSSCYINDIEKWLSRVTGRKVFDDSIYYFDRIPTLVEPLTVAWIVLGALFISAVACIWPAQRAARLHPVRALRYE